MKNIVYLALGSNLGNRIENLRAAITKLAPDFKISGSSPVYQTPPWGFDFQPAFLNQVVVGETHLIPVDLLKYLKNIESVLGRRPTFRNGPRTIDLDILFYDELIIDQSDLVIPHPRLHERAFVLVPLADIAPDFHHPVFGLSVKEMLTVVDRTGVEAFTD
jgi:2-amino-4-hydroxy-6-hydroxymethyldihydropteridine diphosphokinase